MKEAELRETETGLVPEGKGWFVVNARDASWLTTEGAGTWLMTGGEQGCTLFMFGARTPGGITHYLPDPVAAKHGASVKERTDDSRDAYADLDWTFTPVKAPWPGT